MHFSIIPNCSSTLKMNVTEAIIYRFLLLYSFCLFYHRTSVKWNYISCMLCSLIILTQLDVFEMYPHCCIASVIFLLLMLSNYPLYESVRRVCNSLDSVSWQQILKWWTSVKLWLQFRVLFG